MKNMTEFLLKEISSYENILKIVSLRLSELRELAKEYGITESSPEVQVPPIKIEMEKHKQEMMDKMQKIRDDAQKQIEQAMQNVIKQTPNIPSNIPGGMMPMSMPTMPNFKQMEELRNIRVEKNEKK